jgi:hypothetical protein
MAYTAKTGQTIKASTVECTTLNYVTLNPPIPPTSETIEEVLTNGNDAGGLDIINLGEVTVDTLNYTTLNPPISGGGTLEEVLTEGNDAGGLDIVNVGEITCTTLNYDTLNPALPQNDIQEVLTIGDDANGLNIQNVGYFQCTRIGPSGVLPFITNIGMAPEMQVIVYSATDSAITFSPADICFPKWHNATSNQLLTITMPNSDAMDTYLSGLGYTPQIGMCTPVSIFSQRGTSNFTKFTNSSLFVGQAAAGNNGPTFFFGIRIADSGARWRYVYQAPGILGIFSATFPNNTATSLAVTCNGMASNGVATASWTATSEPIAPITSTVCATNTVTVYIYNNTTITSGKTMNIFVHRLQNSG